MSLVTVGIDGGRGLILLSGLSRLHIYPSSGAHIRMIQGSEKVREHPCRNAALFPTVTVVIVVIQKPIFLA